MELLNPILCRDWHRAASPSRGLPSLFLSRILAGVRVGSTGVAGGNACIIGPVYKEVLLAPSVARVLFLILLGADDSAECIQQIKTQSPAVKNV